MNKSILVSLLLTVCLNAHSIHAAEPFSTPRTQWDQPDLQGVWNFASEVPMQRPEHFGERQFLSDEEIVASNRQALTISDGYAPRKTTTGIEAFYNDTIWMERALTEGRRRTSLIVYPLNGRIPQPQSGVEYLPGGEQDTQGTRPVRFAVGGIGRGGPEDRGLSERCLMGFNSSPQYMPSVYNNNIQIVQHRDHVVLLTEMIHDARIIKLDQKPALDPKIGLWSGDSTGYWEGDTLIIETRNFNGLTQSFEGYGSSSGKVLTERLTRVGAQSLDYQFTIDDPLTFTDSLTALIPMTKVDAQLYEYACHEGNYGMGNMLRAARSKDAADWSNRGADLDR